LGRVEREFIRKVCTSIYVRRVFDRAGCPVIAYGQVVFESLFEDDWLDPGLGVRDLFVPIFQMEAVDFLNPPNL